jgi:hypothetical protein
MLSHQEKTNILSKFPNIKLSYENITHKKVSNCDIILAIPEGKKCFAWFTKYQEKNVCFIMELAENKQIFNIKFINTTLKNESLVGSIFYGTLFYYQSNKVFSIEDIFYHKEMDISRHTWMDKFRLLKEIMSSHQKQLLDMNNHFVIFGLPILSNNIDEIMDKVKNIKYKINSIQFRNFYKYSQILFTPYEFFISTNVNNINISKKEEKSVETVVAKKEARITNSNSNTSFYQNQTQNYYKKKKEVVFQVKPDIQNDIYHLYCANNNDNNNEYLYYSTAFIPNFTTSVMMNQFFRNIKENVNLDALEESDDEDEFQNEKIDRFVNLELSYLMICSYDYKFKKWTPIRLAKTDEKIISVMELSMLEKNKY